MNGLTFEHLADKVRVLIQEARDHQGELLAADPLVPNLGLNVIELVHEAKSSP